MKNIIKSVVRKKTHPKTSWKHFQKESNNHKTLILGVCALVIMLGIILVGKFFFFISTLSKPFNPDSSQKIMRNYLWDGKSLINIAVNGESTYIISLNPKEEHLVVMQVPDDAYVNVPFDFGKWPVRSVYSLGQAESKPIGASLFKSTLSMNFGIPIDGYVLLSNPYSELSSTQFIEQFRSNPLTVYSMMKSNKTDLSVVELWRLWTNLKGLRFDKIKSIDLVKNNITDNSKLADGSKIFNLNQAKLDQLIQDSFEDSQLALESFSVGIINTTDHVGLAERAARVVNNLGGRVIFTNSSSERLDRSYIAGKDSYTKDKLIGLFSPKCYMQKASRDCNQSLEQVSSSRADITIFLGEDYFRQISDRNELN